MAAIQETAGGTSKMDSYPYLWMTLAWRVVLILILAFVVFLQLVLHRRLRRLHRDIAFMRALLNVWARMWNQPPEKVLAALENVLNQLQKDCPP